MPLLIIFAACGRFSNAPDYLDEPYACVVEERDLLIAEQEAQRYSSEAEAEAERNKISYSFRAYLGDVAELLGIDALYVADEDIELQGNFVAARSTYQSNEVRLFFRYWLWGEEIQWVLMEYSVGGISGPGFLDAGRSWWQWKQEDIFFESFTMRFYSHIDIYPELNFYYFDEEVLPENWQGQVIGYMQRHAGIQLADLWFEGSRLVADLTPAAAMSFNWGSLGGSMRSRSLIDSLATLPYVTEIEVLVGGQRGVVADHFSFAGVFPISPINSH